MLQRSVRGSWRTGPAGRDTPVGMSLDAGAVAVAVACVFAAAVPPSEPVLRWSFVLAAVGGYAALVAEFGSALFLAAAGFLIFNGYVANSSSELAWHGRTDAQRLATVFLAAFVRWAAGRIHSAAHRAREKAMQRGSDPWPT
jgi:hypothetical protein